MGMIKCEKGHYYDGSNFYICPQCGIEIELVDIVGYTKQENDYEETVLIGKDAEYEETVKL